MILQLLRLSVYHLYIPNTFMFPPKYNHNNILEDIEKDRSFYRAELPIQAQKGKKINNNQHNQKIIVT